MANIIKNVKGHDYATIFCSILTKILTTLVQNHYEKPKECVSSPKQSHKCDKSSFMEIISSNFC